MWSLCPLPSLQVKYLVAMFDVDGDKLVTPAEVLDVLKQMLQVCGVRGNCGAWRTA